MESGKKGFLIYFDKLEQLQLLPLEQQGLVLGAITAFAQEAERDADAGAVLNEFLHGKPAMTPDTQMAYRMICTDILRDTRKWKQRRDAVAARTGGKAAPGKTTAAQLDDMRSGAGLEKYIRQVNNGKDTQA